jgi:hypothetical protein
VLTFSMTSIVIDLITPPTSPVGAGTGALSAPSVNGDSIDLCTPPSSPTAAAPPAAAAKRPLSSGGPSVSVKVQRQDAVAPSSSSAAGPSRMEEDEVLETAAPPAPVQKDVRMADDSNDDDVTCTGRTGDNALLDFPHARENCVAFKFVQGQESKCCDNCYCYVCDAPAKDCPEWEAEHCKASHTSAAWQQRRAQWKARLAAAAAAKAAAAAGPVRWAVRREVRCVSQARRRAVELRRLLHGATAGLPEGGAAARGAARLHHAAPVPKAEPRLHD